MRIYTNQQKIKNNRRIAQVLFFVSLALLLGGLLVTNLGSRNDLILSIVPCIVMPIALLTTFISVRLTNEYIRDPRPEDALQTALKGINQNSVLYNYLFKPNHVLVSPDGVFTFTTRFQDGPYKIEGDQIVDFRANGPIGRFLSFMRQEGIGKPFKDAQEDAQAIQTLLTEAGHEVEVQPVIVFISNRIRLEVNEPVVPVVVTRKDKEPSLRTFRRDQKRKHGQLTGEQVNAIEKTLNAELSIEGAGEEKTETVEDDE
jgi:hypothetical protein